MTYYMYPFISNPVKLRQLRCILAFCCSSFPGRGLGRETPEPGSWSCLASRVLRTRLCCYASSVYDTQHHACVCVYVYYVCMYRCIYLYTRTYVYIYIYIYMDIYIYIYVERERGKNKKQECWCGCLRWRVTRKSVAKSECAPGSECKCWAA